MNENQAWIKQQADKRRQALIEDFLDTVQANEEALTAAGPEGIQVDPEPERECDYDASNPLRWY